MGALFVLLVMFAMYVRSIPPKEILLPNATMPSDPIIDPIPVAETTTATSYVDADDIVGTKKHFRVSDDAETLEL